MSRKKQKTSRKTNPAAKSRPEHQQPSRRTTRKEEARAQAKKKQQLQILAGALAVAVIVIAVVIFINRPSSGGIEIDYSDVEIAQSAAVQNQGDPLIDLVESELQFNTGSIVGDPNAPVTFHIYSDFQCHFCKIFHDETLPKIVDDFVRDGQVKLVFHDFPRLGTDSAIADPNDLAIEIEDPNNESAQAAHAAMCAGEQDAYLQMSDKIFANYGGVQADTYTQSNLSRFADDLDLDAAAFNACMESGRYFPAIVQSVTQGQSLGISGIPTFVLDNGSGEINVLQQTAEGYDLLKRQIEAAIQTAE